MRSAVIGDVGGHREQFEALLEDLGVDTRRGRVPKDLVVIQVGDLIHRGPDSAGVIALVERLVEHPNYVQLIGNHEALYLQPGGPDFVWPSEDQLGPDEVALLEGWFEEGLLSVAHAIPAGHDGRQTLVTHAGLGPGFARALGIDTSSAEAAAAGINDVPRASGDDPLWWPGRMLSGGSPADVMAGPLWAEASHEVAFPWYLAGVAGVPSFHQAVGHSSPVRWYEMAWTGHPLLHGRSHVLPSLRHVEMVVHDDPEVLVTCIDPGNGRRPAPAWAPLLVEHR